MNNLLQEAFETWKAEVWINGDRRENINRMSLDTLWDYTYYLYNQADGLKRSWGRTNSLSASQMGRFRRCIELLNQLRNTPAFQERLHGDNPSQRYIEMSRNIDEYSQIVQQWNLNQQPTRSNHNKLQFGESFTKVELNEASIDDFALGTAGYITDDGKIIYANEYHGEDPDLEANQYVEFSNTHPEEDTCIRIYKKPNDIQYSMMQKIIDKYLNAESYCKIEIWKNKQYDYYEVFSLYENACSDSSWEEKIGNWTGYKLVQIIKNKFNEVNESVEIHDELNPKIWTDDQKLKPEVKSKVEEIVDTFVDILKERNISIKVEDIYILGSNANYNYNEASDLDIHIIADEESLNCDKDHLPIIYDCMKTLFNNKYDISIYGINVELYVENAKQLSNVATGIYSLKNGWIKEPSRYNIPEIDNDKINNAVTFWENKYQRIVANPTIENIEDFIDSIYELRIKSIQEDGEFGEGNLIFKEVRRKGILDDLKDLKTEVESKELSLESLMESSSTKLYEYDGPAFDKNDSELGYFKDYMLARSRAEALNRINFKIKVKLGFNPVKDVIYLEPYCLEEVQIEDDSEEPKVCSKCGLTLTDSGECPVCDLGDESGFDNMTNEELLEKKNNNNDGFVINDCSWTDTCLAAEKNPIIRVDAANNYEYLEPHNPTEDNKIKFKVIAKYNNLEDLYANHPETKTLDVYIPKINRTNVMVTEEEDNQSDIDK